jgi:hypothetical protein
VRFEFDTSLDIKIAYFHPEGGSKSLTQNIAIYLSIKLRGVTCEKEGQNTYVVGKRRNVTLTVSSDVRAVKSSRLSEREVPSSAS